MKKLLFLFLFTATLASGQSAQRIYTALQTQAGSNYTQIIPNAQVTVCTYNAQLTCSVQVTIYSDVNLTQTVTQPLSANPLGVYQYYIQNGTQVVEKVCGPYNQCISNAVFIGSGLGGGSVTVNPGTTNQIARYSGNTTISGSTKLTDNLTTLAYTGTGGLTLEGAPFIYYPSQGDSLGVGTSFIYASGAQYDTATGAASLVSLTSGIENTANGYTSCGNITSGSDNTCIGWASLESVSTGANNTAVGAQAGQESTGSNDTFIGAATTGSANSDSNETVIGSGTTGNGSNTITIGNSSITDNYFTGIIHTGSLAPTSPLAAAYGGLGLDTHASTGCPSVSSGTWSVGTCPSGTVNSGTQHHVAVYATSTNAVSNDSTLTDDGTTLNYTGTSGFSATSISVNTLPIQYSSTYTTIAIGTSALSLSLASGAAQNINIGNSSGAALTTGNEDINIGYEAGNALTTGASNTSVGYEALLVATTQASDTAIGTQALAAATTSGGGQNTAIGQQALYHCTTCTGVTAVGVDAGYTLTTNNTAVFVGFEAGYLVTTNAYNTAIGAYSLYNASNSAAINNTAIGNSAGEYYSGGSNLTDPIDSTFLGYLTEASASGNTNETVIGYAAVGNGSNTVTLGNTSVTKTYLAGVVLPQVMYSNAGTQLAACGSGTVGGEAVVSDATSLTPGTAYSISAGAGTDRVHVQCTYTGSAYAWQTM